MSKFNAAYAASVLASSPMEYATTIAPNMTAAQHKTVGDILAKQDAAKQEAAKAGLVAKLVKVCPTASDAPALLEALMAMEEAAKLSRLIVSNSSTWQGYSIQSTLPSGASIAVKVTPEPKRPGQR